MEVENMMPDRPRHLNQLELELLALSDEAMLLEVLDGFIAGLLVCPEPIPAREWLHWVWDSDGGDRPAFESLEQFNRVLGLVTQYYDGIARTLAERPDRYRPLFAVDARNNDILWELWIDGFETAYKLRPSAWRKYFTADPKAAQAISGLRTLIGINQRNPRPSEEAQDAPGVTAPEDIERWTVILGKCRLTMPNLDSRQDLHGSTAHGDSVQPRMGNLF
jgi:uncharacterized protein